MKNKPKPIRNALLFFMKITLIHMLITSVSIMMGYAVDSSGQEVLERKLTLQAQNANVKSVLAEIEKKADVKFTYRIIIESPATLWTTTSCDVPFRMI